MRRNLIFFFYGSVHLSRSFIYFIPGVTKCLSNHWCCHGSLYMAHIRVLKEHTSLYATLLTRWCMSVRLSIYEVYVCARHVLGLTLLPCGECKIHHKWWAWKKDFVCNKRGPNVDTTSRSESFLAKTSHYLWISLIFFSLCFVGWSIDVSESPAASYSITSPWRWKRSCSPKRHRIIFTTIWGYLPRMETINNKPPWNSGELISLLPEPEPLLK
jgi:hypothetical protein